MKIAMIGAGAMGGATVEGLIKGQMFKNEDITVSDPSGTVLPNSGGRGTLPFRIAGLALMLMGAAYVSYDFKTRRRRERRLRK